MATRALLSEDTLGVFLFDYTEALGDVSGILERHKQGGFVIITKKRGMWFARPFHGRAREDILRCDLIPSTMARQGSRYACPLLPNDLGEKLVYLDGVFWGLMPFVQQGLDVPTSWNNHLSDLHLVQAAEALAQAHLAGQEVAGACGSEYFLTAPPVVSNLPQYFGKFLKSAAICFPYMFGQPALLCAYDVFSDIRVKPKTYKPRLVPIRPRYVDDELKLAGEVWRARPGKPVTPQDLEQLLFRAVGSIEEEESRLNLPSIVVHGDVNRKSFLFDVYSGNKLGAIAGWSTCHLGLPIYDIARAAVMMCVDWEEFEGHNNFETSRFELFFSTYKNQLNSDFLSVYGEAVNSDSLLYNYMLLVCYRLIAWALEQKLAPYPEAEKWREAKVMMVALNLVHFLHGKLV